MKLIRILQDVVLSGTPKFFKGQQVRVSEPIANDLVTRGHAKFEKGKSEAEVKREKKVKVKTEEEQVSVQKTKATN